MLHTQAVKTETLNGHTIHIVHDPEPFNPRTENDNVTTMVCVHGRYTLGDKQYSTAQEALGSILEEYGVDPKEHRETDNYLNECPIYWLPLYLYDHSGITMRTTAFACPWDSGQVGLVYVTHEKAHEEWPRREDEEHAVYVRRVYEYMRNEVAEYDKYLRGDVYGYIITKEGDEDEEHVDSCFGYYGTEAAMEAGKEYVSTIE